MNRAAYRRSLPVAVLVALIPWAGCSDREMPTEAVPADVGVTSALQGDPGLEISAELIPMMPGWVWTEAWGVNDNGVVVGTVDRLVGTGTGTYEVADAYRWSRDGGTWEATPLLSASWYTGQARDVNEDGTVVGYGTTTPGDTYGYGLYGFRWDAEVVEVLLPSTGYHSYAFAINSGGDAVGEELTLAAGGYRGVRWPAGGLTGTLSGKGPSGENTAAGARDISETGEIVGWAATDLSTSPLTQAVVWESNSPVYLGTLTGDETSEANGIYTPDEGATEEGATLIVGWSADASRARRPVIWVDKLISALPTLGGATGEAFAVNDHGYAVGESENGDGTLQATLWLPDGTRTAVALPDPSDASAVSSHARDINDSGMIVGFIAGGEYDRTAVVWQIEDYSPTPPGASEPLEALRDEISELEESGALNHGQANSLMKKVDNAEKKYEQCNDEAGDNIMRAFINEVEALVRSGQLPEADGDRLIELAEQAIAQPEPEHCS